jgi:thiamine biosynthesis lipoprotein
MPTQWHRFEFKAMGSPCVLHLHDARGIDVARVADECTVELGRLEYKYSRYRDDSVLSKLNRSAGDRRGTEVDAETAGLLDHAEVVYRQSGGLFDITAGVLRRAWDFDSGQVPSPEVLAAVLERVGWERLRWRRPRLVLGRGMELDFGGIVKEYAADRVAEYCRRRGIRSGLVDLGGDLSLVGPHPDGEPWEVGIRNPGRAGLALASISLAEGGVTTSGDYQRCMVVDGVRYGHIFDPHSGWPVQGLASVSVVASHCLLAGSISTIAMLKGRSEGPAWLDRLGLPNLRVDREGRVSGTFAPEQAPLSPPLAVGL